MHSYPPYTSTIASVFVFFFFKKKNKTGTKELPTLLPVDVSPWCIITKVFFHSSKHNNHTTTADDDDKKNQN